MTTAAGNHRGSVRSALGPDVQFGYGVLDVQVTVSGARITDISVPSLQTAEPTSQQLSEQAIPVLRSEALAAQSARIDAVSGATYTSEGVLMDNACRYAGPDGVVRIGVRAHGSRVSLTVEDSGPGVTEADRPRLFDRFHRATGQGAGAGLGLAIGNSIVCSTGGRWHVGDSPLGGHW